MELFEQIVSLVMDLSLMSIFIGGAVLVWMLIYGIFNDKE